MKKKLAEHFDIKIDYQLLKQHVNMSHIPINICSIFCLQARPFRDSKQFYLMNGTI